MSNHASKYVASGFAIVIVALVWNYQIHNKTGDLALVSKNLADTEATQVETEKKFPEVSITAKSAVVYDAVEGKYLFELNPDSQLPLASITKLATIYSALKNAPKDFEITIDDKALASDGDFNLKQGSVWHLDELSKFSLVNSANDGAQAIADELSLFLNHDFVAVMNETVKNMGLTQTYFINPTGLDESKTLPSGYGSAEDIAHLAISAFSEYKDIFSVTTLSDYIGTSQSGEKFKATNTNQDTLNISGLRLSKTGFTDLAGGNLVIVMEIEPARPIAIVVLGSTKDGRFEDVNTLAKATIDFMAN